MKQMACRYLWRPNVNRDVEIIAQNCLICRQTAKAPPAEFQSWPQPKKPWERIHLDFAGPFLGKMWLICVDAFSQYPYVTMLNIGQTTSKHTIDALQQIFSFEGLPDTIVSDNGVQFVSREFKNFCVKLNIKDLTSPIFHPASNGEAESFVQTFKRGLIKNVEGGKSLIDFVRFVLATYRSSPHPSLDWRTPAELLHGRQPKNLMSLFLPGTSTVCRSKTTDGQNVEKPRISKYYVGDLVFARNYASGAKWFSAVVTKNVGSMMYMVKTNRGLWKRQQNQLQPRFCDFKSKDSTVVSNDQRNNAIQFAIPSNTSGSNNNRKAPSPVSDSAPASSGRRTLRRNRKASDYYQAVFS